MSAKAQPKAKAKAKPRPKARPRTKPRPGVSAARSARAAPGGPSFAHRALSACGGGIAAGARGLAWSGRGAGVGVGRALLWALRHRDVQRGLALLALGGALCFASAAVRRQVQRLPRAQVVPSSLATGAIPDGLSPRVRDDLQRLPLPQGSSTYDRRLVPFAAALLADLEWVEEVERVAAGPSGLEFSLVARRPVAQVGEGDHARVLTHDAAVIDRAFAAAPGELPRVLGVPTSSRLLPRRRALAATLEVLEQVRGLGVPVLAIDVSGLDRRDPSASEVLIHLDGGAVVEWGRAGNDDRPRLPGPSKRAALDEFLTNGPPLPTVERVSLRWDETVYTLRPAEPLAAAGR